MKANDLRLSQSKEAKGSKLFGVPSPRQMELKPRNFIKLTTFASEKLLTGQSPNQRRMIVPAVTKDPNPKKSPKLMKRTPQQMQSAYLAQLKGVKPKDPVNVRYRPGT